MESVDEKLTHVHSEDNILRTPHGDLTLMPHRCAFFSCLRLPELNVLGTGLLPATVEHNRQGFSSGRTHHPPQCKDTSSPRPKKTKVQLSSSRREPKSVDLPENDWSHTSLSTLLVEPPPDPMRFLGFLSTLARAPKLRKGLNQTNAAAETGNGTSCPATGAAHSRRCLFLHAYWSMTLVRGIGTPPLRMESMAAKRFTEMRRRTSLVLPNARPSRHPRAEPTRRD